MIIGIFLNLLVILSTYLLTKRFFSEKSFVDFILSWFTLFLAQILVVELYLGIMGQLYFFNVILLHLGIFLVIYSIYRKRKYPPFSSPDIDFIFNNKILLFAVSIFLGFFLVKLWINLINPPIGADSLIYHLTFPATWLKNATLKNPIIISGHDIAQATTNSTYYNPINAELFFLWLLFPLRNAFLADIAEAPFYFISILALYSILRKFNINKSISLFIALLWTLIPNCLKQIEQGSYVDIICAALFFLSFNFILLWDKEFNLKNAFTFGLCLGLFVGTKTLNTLWSLALLPCFIYVLFKHRKEIKISGIFLNLFFVILASFILGGYPYIRNYILTRNIVYPVKVTIFGRVLMPGYIDRLSFSNLVYPLKEFSLKKLFFSEGLGLQFLAFILPATFIPQLSLLFVKRLRKNFWQHFFIFLIPTYMFLMYLFYIKAYWSRYLYPYLGIGLIVSAIFLDNFKWGIRYINILGSIAVISSIAELAGHMELVASIILSLGILFILLAKRNISINKKIKKTVAISLVCILIGALGFLNHKYNNEEYNRYIKIYEDKEVAIAWKWLDDNTGFGKRIAYTGRAEFYPLFGRGLKNDVFYISVNDKPSIPHYYPDGLYRKEKDFFSWKNNLLNKKIDYLFIYLPHTYESSEFPIEDMWAQEDPEEFKLVFKNNKTKIYSFIK